MAAVDFPNTPTNGQEFSANNKTWVWDNALQVWKSVTSNTEENTVEVDYTSTDAVLAGQIFG
jgi:hypothetical protein